MIGSQQLRNSVRRTRRFAAVAAAVVLALCLPYQAGAQDGFNNISGGDRTHLKPGWNMFSPQQDVELGRQASVEAEQQVPLLNDSRVDNYLNSIGRRLGCAPPRIEMCRVSC